MKGRIMGIVSREDDMIAPTLRLDLKSKRAGAINDLEQKFGECPKG